MDDPARYQGLGLDNIHEKVKRGERLTLEDGALLFACPDVTAIGALAHQVRRRFNDNTTYYVMNQHINYSNICVNGCRFCAFAREPGDPRAFQLTLEEILGKIKESLKYPITEVHIVGGCHPDLPLSYYESIIREIKDLRPQVLIKAFTAVEIAHFARMEQLSTREVLKRLQEAGLNMLPGGGAEVFSARVRNVICPQKLSGDGWLKVVREAHQLGIRTNATLLYGHIESHRERLEHLLALRRLQDETGGFVCFIPLPFQTANSKLRGIEPVTGMENLKTIAISRLMLDNFAHIKAYWIMLTLELAQLALYFGADDLDGTVLEEKIGHMAGAQSNQSLTRLELERIIRDAGFDPIERDCFFQPVSQAV